MKNNFTREEIVNSCVAEAKKNVAQIADNPTKAHVDALGGVENDPVFIEIVDDAFDSIIFDKKSKNATVDEDRFSARERRLIVVHVAHAYADALLRQVKTK